MKLFKKINPIMGVCTLAIAIICAIEPTLITCLCCGLSIGLFAADTIFNWKTR